MQGQQRIEAKRRNRGRGGSSWIFALLALLIGVVIGFGIGYYTVDIVNATPGQLGRGSKLAWIDMTADSYQVTENLEVAQRRLGLNQPDSSFFEPAELADLFDDRIKAAENAGELGRAEWLRKLAGNLNITPAPLSTDGGTAGTAGGEPSDDPAAAGTEGMASTALMACGGILAALVVFGLIAALWTRRRQNKSEVRPRTTMASTRNRATVGPTESGSKAAPAKAVPPPASSGSTTSPPPPPPPAPAATKKVEPDATKIDSETDEALKQLFDEQPAGERTLEIEYSDSAPQPVRYLPPLEPFPVRYNYGDDGYDMSYSIETPNSEFLGECGVGISDTLNKGTPQQATAFEVWLFDKDDIRTVTKVLLSEHAWGDEALREHLAPKGELILVQENETIELETKSLRVRARVREAEYGTQSEVSRGYFERLVLELIPQQKQQ